MDQAQTNLLGIDLGGTKCAVVLGSLARYLGDTWMDTVRHRFHEQALPDAARLCRVVPAALGERLQDLSALVVALDFASTITENTPSTG